MTQLILALVLGLASSLVWSKSAAAGYRLTPHRAAGILIPGPVPPGPVVVVRVEHAAEPQRAEPQIEQPTPRNAHHIPISIEGALRVGFGVGAGNVLKELPLNDVAKYSVPIQLDFFVRHDIGVAFGLYGVLALNAHGSALEDCNKCANLNFQAGFQSVYHILNGNWVDPWVGFGIGLEELIVTRPIVLEGLDTRGRSVFVNGRAAQRLFAFPQVSLQAGVDLGNSSVGFGPYLSASWARYSSIVSDETCTDAACSGLTVSASADTITDDSRRNHFWFVAGLRLAFMRGL